MKYMVRATVLIETTGCSFREAEENVLLDLYEMFAHGSDRDILVERVENASPNVPFPYTP